MSIMHRTLRYNPALVEDTNRTSDLLAELGFNSGGQPPPYEEEDVRPFVQPDREDEQHVQISKVEPKDPAPNIFPQNILLGME